MGKHKRKKRGFPLGIVVGFDEKAVIFWRLFSETIRKYKSMELTRKWKNSNEKDKYRYFQQIIKILKPLFEEGLKSVLLVSPQGNKWSNEFLKHLQKHHRYLINSKRSRNISFGQMDGFASKLKQVNYLMQKENFHEKIKNISSNETYNLILELEKSLNEEDPKISIVYGLTELEALIYKGGKKDDSVNKKIDYLILTEDYLENHRNKNRIYRLKQIAENKGITTKIVPEDIEASDRIAQFGGIIAFKKS
ncbi:MAG: hypothetical protein GF317_11965 [Candidatus Lokiarchaeota archaeon]|nr:hypothetical protein [Candidatus Lokiarchaeota archaeon]MBD3200364.1 hypothetical protein [Candidatus Lokiarchaeota archaeon]